MQKKVWQELEEVVVQSSMQAVATPDKMLSPVPVVPDTKQDDQVLYGFPTQSQQRPPVVSKPDQVIVDRRVRAKHFLSKRQALSARIGEWGLEPLAVVPQHAWNAICKKFGLYRFEHITKDGEVPASTDGATYRLGESFEMWNKRAKLYWVVLCGLGTLACLIALMSTKQREIDMAFIWSAGACVFGVGSFTLVEWISNLITRFWHPSASAVCQSLWPQGCDEQVSAGIQLVKVRFPHPDQKFNEALHSVVHAGLTIAIAAVPDAITIDPELVKGMIEEIKTAHKLEQERQAQWHYYDHYDDDGCPVLYVIEDGLVVIFAQYGTFKNEKHAVRWAKRQGVALI